MNARHIDYYFWLNSDWAYLGADRLEALARRHRLEVRYKPVDLPLVYARTGGILLSQRALPRQAYRIVELRRWSRKLGLPVNPRPAFMCPDAGLASRIVIGAGMAGLPVAALSRAILHAQWVENRDISSIVTLRAIVRGCGFDHEMLMAAAAEPAVARRYHANTDEAIMAGVFGSPSYLFDGELFWGQDRLEMLEDRVAGA